MLSNVPRLRRSLMYQGEAGNSVSINFRTRRAPPLSANISQSGSRLHFRPRLIVKSFAAALRRTQKDLSFTIVPV